MPISTTWIVVAVVVALAVFAIVMFNRLIRARKHGARGVERHRRAIAPPFRPDPEPRRNGQGLCRPRAWRVRRHHDTACCVGGGAGVAQTASSETALQGALGRLLAVAEAYPELKADQNFLKLQTEFSAIEDELQMARRYYNGTGARLQHRDPDVSGRADRACRRHA